MLVDFGLFSGDDLLQRGSLKISERYESASYENIIIQHRLKDDHAEIILEVFSNSEKLIESNLHMPIHQSEDWESIELERFTFAFKCILDA